jgi:hypothetical protein
VPVDEGHPGSYTPFLMKKAWICAAIAVLQVGFVCRAASHLEPPDLERYLRWGALRARPGFEVANFGYDSNILSSADNVVPDYTATVFGKLDGLVLFGSRGFLTFEEKLGYTAYLENTNQNYPIQLGTARATVPVSRFGLFGELTVNRDTERPVSQVDIRPDRAQDGLGLGLILEPGWRTTVEISRQATRWSYFDPDYTAQGGQSVSEILDRTVTGTKLAANYDLHGRSNLTFEAELGEIDFDSLELDGGTKNSRAWTLMPGLLFGDGGRLTGVARIGWTRINAEDPDRADYSGAVGRIRLAYRPLGRATFRLDANRRPEFSVTTGSVYVVYTEAGLGGLYYLNRWVGVEAGAMAGTVLYPGGNVDSDRTDDIRRYDLALRFRMAENSLGRRVEYRLRWTTYQRRSEVPNQNIDRGTLGVSAVVGF